MPPCHDRLSSLSQNTLPSFLKVMLDGCVLQSYIATNKLCSQAQGSGGRTSCLWTFSPAHSILAYVRHSVSEPSGGRYAEAVVLCPLNVSEPLSMEKVVKPKQLYLGGDRDQRIHTAAHPTPRSQTPNSRKLSTSLQNTSLLRTQTGSSVTRHLAGARVDRSAQARDGSRRRGARLSRCAERPDFRHAGPASWCGFSVARAPWNACATCPGCCPAPRGRGGPCVRRLRA